MNLQRRYLVVHIRHRDLRGLVVSLLVPTMHDGSCRGDIIPAPVHGPLWPGFIPSLSSTSAGNYLELPVAGRYPWLAACAIISLCAHVEVFNFPPCSTALPSLALALRQ
jgi:hypothetical protein